MLSIYIKKILTFRNIMEKTIEGDYMLCFKI